MIDEQQLRKYATVVLRKGVNLQEGQPLLINAPLEGMDFTKEIVRQAYALGAKDVHVNWTDDELTLLKYKHAPTDVLGNFPKWRVLLNESYAEDNAALLSIYATNPDLLKDVDPERINIATKAQAEAMANFQQYVMNDKITWSVISIPTADWAQKVYPNVSATVAVKKLWKAILKTVRVDAEDPIKAWDQHNKKLKNAREMLNDKGYTKLIFKAPGTHLEIGLPEQHIWHGGAAVSEKGTVFNPNMPTEEVFTAPHKYEVNGTVKSTMPLNYGGTLIDNFTLTFEKGKVVDYTAEQGEETLKHLLETDEGASRLGEVALVPVESPIAQSDTIFYNTLFDENASCHIALGKAYPTCIQGGAELERDELDQYGLNDSFVHVDFMIGSDELSIDGVMKDGTTEPVFRKGSWAFDIDQ